MAGRTRDELLRRYVATEREAFLSLLVHDLRGPLTGIISAARLIETLLKDGQPEDVAKIAEVNQLILEASGNLRTILEAASDYDRHNRGLPDESDGA